jgi:hypothetical protein
MMEIKHTSHRGTSADPVGDALVILTQLFEHIDREHPVTVDSFWQVLRERGFYFMHAGTDGRLQKVMDTDPKIATWGSYFSGLILAHALDKKLIAGDAATGSFYPKS